MTTNNPTRNPNNPDEFEILAEAFHKELTDQERWNHIRIRRDDYIVYLDNDDTFAHHVDDPKDSRTKFQFDHFIGRSQGVGKLLDACFIQWQEV